MMSALRDKPVQRPDQPRQDAGADGPCGKFDPHLPGPRVELVDNAHADWQRVLDLVDRLGRRDMLCVDEAGWLSARQSVFAAFVKGESGKTDTPAGLLCFHVHPSGRDVEAHLDALEVTETKQGEAVGPALRDAAVRRAKTLNCARFKGID